MDFRTIVSLERDEQIELTPHSNVMLIGSCFADHVGQLLQRSLPKQQVVINPSGTLYNPWSICHAIRALLAENVEEAIDEDGYFTTAAGEWRHWDYATLFSADTREGLKQKLIEAWQIGKRLVDKLDLLFVTFSTDHVYQLTEMQGRERVVANCHKQPSHKFSERVASGENMLCQWGQTIEELRRKRPDVKVVFTLSPYRYAKYGMHENALSKARLLLLIDQLEKKCQGVKYFPAYEIINDELRDYRFYAEDMLHPSSQAVAYVWERFCNWAFTPLMHEYVKERMALVRALEHRPLHPESEEYQRFLQRTEEKRLTFERKWKQAF